jgi:FAD/FMN-containing dehydrogenase
MATTTHAAITTAGGLAWRNWGGNQTRSPLSLEKPASEAEIVELVRGAAERGERVKVFVAGHSFTDIACTEGRLVSLDGYGRILEVDAEAATIKAEAGITIARLARSWRVTGWPSQTSATSPTSRSPAPSPPPPTAPARSSAT